MKFKSGDRVVNHNHLTEPVYTIIGYVDDTRFIIRGDWKGETRPKLVDPNFYEEDYFDLYVAPPPPPERHTVELRPVQPGERFFMGSSAPSGQVMMATDDNFVGCSRWVIVDDPS